MKKFLISFIIPILTFTVGVFVCQMLIPKVTLSEISDNLPLYEGRIVEIETYLETYRLSETLWTVTDFDKTPSAVTAIYFEDDSIKPEFLNGRTNYEKVKMAKVLIKGKVSDGCKIDGKGTCCFFKIIKIEVQDIKMLSPVEDYVETE